MDQGDKQTKLDLQHQMEQLDAFFQTNLDLLGIFDSSVRAVRLNPAWEQALGFPMHELIGARILDFIHPCDSEAALGTIAQLRDRAEVLSFLARFRHQSGGFRWLEWRITARDELIFASVRDVTESKLKEAALLKSEEKFAKAFQVISDALFISDVETGQFLEVNESFLRLTGYRRDEIIGRNARNLALWVDLADRTRYFEILKAQRRVRGYLARLRHRSGLIYWGEMASDPLVIDGRPCIISATRDVTQQINYETTLRESEERFRAIFDQAAVGVLFVELATGKFLQVNQRACEILGYTKEEMFGLTFMHLTHPDDLAIDVANQHKLAAGEITEIDRKKRYLHKNGETVWVNLHVKPLGKPGQPTEFAVTVIEDITEHKRLERGLLQAHKMDSLGSLAGGVAHDMNNILGAVMGLASSIRMSTRDDTELAEDMDAMVKACERGRNLVRSLLDFARQDLPEARVFNLNTVVRDQSSLLGRSLPTRLQLVTELQPDLANVTGDPGALSRALLNLCSNSIDAMGQGGVLTIRTRNTDGHQVELIVEDTGCGMGKETLDKALDPFFTTKQKGKGTGLGLPIVYGAVKAHRGQLELDSVPGKGTRIVLRLPASEQVLPDAATKASDSGISDAPGLRVLLIDDDELIQKSVSAQLRRLGHQVTIASNGHEALMKLDAGLEVDLAVLDITMPILDGAATLPHLRRLRPNLGVILATGKVDDAARALARTFRDVRLLPKPYSLGELRNEIAPWLERLGLAKSI
jgi:two-component system cell cycle sensor histidine kinase/response regulator CckA